MPDNWIDASLVPPDNMDDDGSIEWQNGLECPVCGSNLYIGLKWDRTHEAWFPTTVAHYIAAHRCAKCSVMFFDPKAFGDVGLTRRANSL